MPLAPHSPAAEAQDHASLIVALDAGDLAGAELLAAEALATSCPGCAALLPDLAAIRVAMAALPVPPRRRDYRLTTGDAARLRPSGLRRLLEWLAAPGSAVRPLATGLATLGVVGLLLTSGLSGMLSGFGGAGAAPVPAAAPQGAPQDNASPDRSRDESSPNLYGPHAAPSGGVGSDPGIAATAAPASGPTAAPAPGLTAAPSEAPGGMAGEAATADPTGERASTSDSDRDDAKAAGRDAAATVPLPALVSLALLAAGLALLAGRVIVRRRLS